MVKNNTTVSDVKKIKAFANLDKETLTGLAKICKKIRLKKGMVLFNELDMTSSIYGMLEGKLSMSKHSKWGQKVTFFILGRGDLVNELVLDNGKAIATAEAYVNTVLLEFDKEELIKLMEKDFELSMTIIKAMGKKQRRLCRQLKNSLTMRIDKKLSVKLWKLGRDHGIKRGDWVVLDMKITVTSLSYLLGSSRETVSRAMKLLQDEGLVKWEDKKLCVLHNELLEYYENEK